MIEKLEFYHGAALVRLVEDSRCAGISKSDLGYLVNGDRLVFMKYTTKANSPWRFTFSNDDLARFNLANNQFRTCILALVCGGDGICCTAWEDARDLLDGNSGWIAAKRRFNGCYEVSGPAGTLDRKVPLNQWPGIVFGLEVSE